MAPLAAVSALGTAAVALLWGTSGVLIRHLPLAPVAVACLRALIGGAALAVWLAVNWRHYGEDVRVLLARRQWPLVFSGVLLAVHWLTFVSALLRAPIGTVLTGVYLAPVAVAALARRTLGERLSTIQLLALVAAAGGGAIVLRPQAAGGWVSVVLIAFSATAYAGSITLSKYMVHDVKPTVVAATQLGVAAVVLGPFTLLDDVRLSAEGITIVMTLGVLYSGIASLVYLACLRCIPAVTSAIVLCLEPVSAFTAGWLFLGEQPAPVTMAGAVIVLMAGTVAVIDAGSGDGRSRAGSLQ